MQIPVTVIANVTDPFKPCKQAEGVHIVKHDACLEQSSIEFKGECSNLGMEPFLVLIHKGLELGDYWFDLRRILPCVCKAFLPFVNAMYQLGEKRLAWAIKQRLCKQVPAAVEMDIRDDAEDITYDLNLCRTEVPCISGTVTFKLFPRWTLVMIPSIYHIHSYYHHVTQPTNALLMVKEAVLEASCADDLEEKQTLTHWIDSKEMCPDNVFMSPVTLRLIGVHPDSVV